MIDRRSIAAALGSLVFLPERTSGSRAMDVGGIGVAPGFEPENMTYQHVGWRSMDLVFLSLCSYNTTPQMEHTFSELLEVC